MIALLLALAGSTAGAGEKIPVVLTTDCGVEVDDQWALAHLALSPRIDLRGVVTTHAPGLTPSASVESVHSVLAGLNLPRTPPVVAGSPVPLKDRNTPRVNPGVELILRESRVRHPGGRIVVVAIGAATDVASALLADPTLADRVEVVAMGFDAWPEGGDPWNVKNDVKAWQVLLESTVPLVVGDGAVGKRDLLMTRESARQRLGRTGPAGESLVALLERWLENHRGIVTRITGDENAWPIWDEVTVAYLLGLTRTRTVPRPTLRDNLSFDHTHTHGTVTWVMSVRRVPLWNDLAACLTRRR